MCGPDPWLVLHKIESPTKMRYMGQRFAQCPPEGAVPEQPATATSQGDVSYQL